MLEIAYTRPNGEAKSLVLDVAISEQHRSSATATEHPVEQGVNITDHIRPEADELTLEGFVSNTPIRQPDSNMDGVTGSKEAVDLFEPALAEFQANRHSVGDHKNNAGLGRPAGPRRTATVLTFSGLFDRARSVYDELRAICASGTLVRVVTSLREYDSLAILGIEVDRDAGSANALPVSITLRRIHVVQTQTIAAPLPREPRAHRRENAGNQPTSDAAAVNESAASRGISDDQLDDATDALHHFGVPGAG